MAIYCANCGVELNPGAGFCGACGREVSPVAARSAGNTSALLIRIVYCANCGAELNTGADWCVACGRATNGVTLLSKPTTEALAEERIYRQARANAREHTLEQGRTLIAGIVAFIAAIIVGGFLKMVFPGLHPGVALAIGLLPGMLAAMGAMNWMDARAEHARREQRQRRNRY